MAGSDSSGGQPSQVTLKTAFTVCFAVVLVATLVVLIIKAEVALILTGLAALLAVALNHLVALLMKRARLRRGPAIAVVLLVLLVAASALGLIVVPAAINQGQSLVNQVPELTEKIRASRVFQLLDQRFHVLQQLQRQSDNPTELASGALAVSAFHAVTGVFSVLGAFATILFLMVFMLAFGPELVKRLLAQTLPERRPRYEGVVSKVYSATGGYLSGLILICTINATLASTCLALLGMPFFLPLGIASGFSSLVPYAGPIVAGGFVTLLTLTTVGAWKALAVFTYFMMYGLLEGNVLAPLVFRRTVHVNPLLTLFAVVFFGELAGIIGAVLAVPLMATAQIIVRELLLIRREKLGDRVPVP
ncbi:AI-2E family transporter [Melittangium boletus]|uniref:AI-2E family transporter n=1 Tax=Melittangium boletus DSM 14713 TaxID=1294270 RepID=A0A250IRT9_9BACT|nr:AI-2E family transporter [Melittangium boletus]ATB33963.1 AI-2E family transporter [Melittangium boletus DSM 14713]